MMRLAIAALVAILVSLLLFWAMHLMVRSDNDIVRTANDRAVIDFVRLKQDSETQRRERRKPEPPKPPKPQIPQSDVAQDAQVDLQRLPMVSLDVNPDLGLSNQSFLSDAVVGMGLGDSDVLPLVAIKPNYPRQAYARKIEGFVRARLEINPEGSVVSVEIIDSEPRGVFEREAIRALYRYKFRPRMVDGQAMPQQAVQTIEFTLGDS
ncbi:MAG: energy transducer TonB [Bacterioplanes sp.]|nr:energy transducer TonB [Bacterioplanes sp.]